MYESAVYRPHAEAPARTVLRPRNEDPNAPESTTAWQELDARRFEIVSRGDFVSGMIFLPSPSSRPAPLLLLQHGTGGSCSSPELRGAADWVRTGLAVAMIDLPLHGERSSPKLSERLVSGLQAVTRGAELDLDSGALVEEFSRQATSDVIRTLDALCALSEIDESRVGFMGLGLGSVVGSYLLAHDDRVRASVLALAGGGQGPKALDPASYLEHAGDTSLLFVSTEGDSVVTESASQALYEAAPGQKRMARFPGKQGALSDDAFAEIGRFLSKELGL